MEQCRDDRERQRRHLATHNIPPAVAFYRMLGFEIVHGGDDATFTSFRAGTSFLNLVAQPAERKWS
jgi:catechol-2,3-dioxygenase